MTLSNNRLSEINSPESYQISLLEEKLQVAHRKQKVGEVVIRKQVETRMINIPIRREKLIVERIGENPEQLTEVVVAEETVNGFKYNELDTSNSLSVNRSQFLSLASAEKLLTDIKQLSSTANTKICVEIVTNCADLETLSELKKICDRY
ncbi:MAG: DUF2382 domain-containing protein [Pleurocapsa sp. SU_5_0]|nr:DUF2382 domain-containing protein [Pleurocapsa sp. SU_5_0]NJO96673.1 DUF2382 domain-containing protein [Pleurocapsa sp. CRU_1_2]NJR47961.1 DUF2382 domain-containing protein [Hyellaceae cyanobacterium CSU_1_1]